MSLSTSTQITIGGVGVWDEDAPIEHVEDNNVYCQRILRTAWTDRFTLANYLKGGNTVVAGTPLYVAGQPYPDSPNLLCTADEMSGEGLTSVGPNGMIAFERAKHVVTYKPPTFAFGDPAQIGSQELDFSQTVLALDQRQSCFKWSGGDPLPPSGMPVLRVSECRFTIRAINRPTIPVATILSLLDCSNSGTFYGAAAEHMIFIGCRTQRNFTTAGAEQWSIQYTFKYRKQGTWNQLFRSGTGGGWTSFTYMDGSTKLFPPANLSALFS